MNHHVQTTKQKRRGRCGMSTVEFALLLPFFALLAAGILMLGHLFYRSVCQSHMAFSAARRSAVKGSPNAAARWVRDEYRAFSMPGRPQVGAHYMAGRPGICTVTIRDSMPALLPGRSGALSVRTRSGATVTITAAGKSLHAGGDNDL